MVWHGFRTALAAAEAVAISVTLCRLLSNGRKKQHRRHAHRLAESKIRTDGSLHISLSFEKALMTDTDPIPLNLPHGWQTHWHHFTALPPDNDYPPDEVFFHFVEDLTYLTYQDYFIDAGFTATTFRAGGGTSGWWWRAAIFWAAG